MILLCFARFIYLQVHMQYISLNQYENFMQKNNVPFYLHLFMNKKNLNCWRRHINQTIFHHCETHNVSIQMIKRHFFMFHFRFFFHTILCCFMILDGSFFFENVLQFFMAWHFDLFISFNILFNEKKIHNKMCIERNFFVHFYIFECFIRKFMKYSDVYCGNIVIIIFFIIKWH